MHNRRVKFDLKILNRLGKNVRNHGDFLTHTVYMSCEKFWKKSGNLVGTGEWPVPPCNKS